nr:hypothetical protein [Tanacetum cinerariifolium]
MNSKRACFVVKYTHLTHSVSIAILPEVSPTNNHRLKKKNKKPKSQLYVKLRRCTLIGARSCYKWVWLDCFKLQAIGGQYIANTSCVSATNTLYGSAAANAEAAVYTSFTLQQRVAKLNAAFPLGDVTPTTSTKASFQWLGM